MADETPAPTTITVTVACSPGPREMDEQTLQLPIGATLRDALLASRWATRLSQTDPALPDVLVEVGVWGRAAALSQVLKERDRVEIYRPLKVDPKTARRERFQKQGARGAGLFAKKRPGAKAGY